MCRRWLGPLARSHRRRNPLLRRRNWLPRCTARYAAFCKKAYGGFLHHHPDGGAPANVSGANDAEHEQLRRTVIAWSLVARPGEQCVLWDLDERVGVDEPWGIDAARVAEIQAAVTELSR